MNEEDTLLYNFLNSFYKKEDSQIELLISNNSCLEFKNEEKKRKGKLENFKFLLKRFSNKKVPPTLILNFGERKLNYKWLDKLIDYKGNRVVITEDNDFKFSDYPGVYFNIINNHSGNQLKFGSNIKNIINLDFDQNVQKIKECFVKAYKNEGEIELTQEKKVKYKEEEFNYLNKFINFLVEYIYNEANQDKEKYKELINKNNGFKFFPGFNKGCPANQRIFISLEDLSIVFCPNLTAEEYNYGKIKKDGKVKAKNNELLITILNTSLKDMPVCETCILNEFCEFDCFLSQKKNSGDFFVPHPEFCRYSHKKIFFLLEAQQKFGLNSPSEKKKLNKLEIN